MVSEADDTPPIVTRAPQLCKRLRSDLTLSVARSHLGDMPMATPRGDEGTQINAAPALAAAEHQSEQSRHERTRPGTAKAKKAAVQRQVGGVHILAWLPLGSNARQGDERLDGASA